MNGERIPQKPSYKKRTLRGAESLHGRRSYARAASRLEVHSQHSYKKLYGIAILLACIMCTALVAGAYMIATQDGVRSQTDNLADKTHHTHRIGDDVPTVQDKTTSEEQQAVSEDQEEHPEETTSSDPADGLSERDKSLMLDSHKTDGWNFESNGEKIVYLTFDDGPSDNTAKILDILDIYHVKATFFVVGCNPSQVYLIKEAYNRGHTIGLHSMTHDYKTIYASEENFFTDLDQIGEVVKDQIGYIPCFVRFPGGSSNTVSKNYSQGIMTRLSDELQKRGYQYYDWNMATGDASGKPMTPQQLTDTATGYGKLTNVIMLAHDSKPKVATVEALPAIIEYYQSQGFSFAALDRSSMVCHHKIAN